MRKKTNAQKKRSMCILCRCNKALDYKDVV